MSELRATVIARIKANAFPLGLGRGREQDFAVRLADDILAIPEIAEALAIASTIPERGRKRRIEWAKQV